MKIIVFANEGVLRLGCRIWNLRRSVTFNRFLLSGDYRGSSISYCRSYKYYTRSISEKSTKGADYQPEETFSAPRKGLPIITPILQLRLLCAHDISVPVESFKIAITNSVTSWTRFAKPRPRRSPVVVKYCRIRRWGLDVSV